MLGQQIISALLVLSLGLTSALPQDIVEVGDYDDEVVVIGAECDLMPKSAAVCAADAGLECGQCVNQRDEDGCNSCCCLEDKKGECPLSRFARSPFLVLLPWSKKWVMFAIFLETCSRVFWLSLKTGAVSSLSSR